MRRNRLNFGTYNKNSAKQVKYNMSVYAHSTKRSINTMQGHPPDAKHGSGIN